MEDLQAKKETQCDLITATPETVALLLAFSKSLNIVKTKGNTFETYLN